MSKSAQGQAAKLIAELWQRNQPLIRERLAQLDAVAAAAASGSLDEAQRKAAESTAHKLSGSLGMFGYNEGTNLAREIENELRSGAPNPARLTELSVSLRSALHAPSSSPKASKLPNSPL